MPVRDSHAEERMDTRQSEQDFNLLRVRDAPSSLGTARSRRYETAAQQAADDTQPFKADVPQQADISIPEHLESRDMDHEPARAPETRNPLEPELLHRNRAGGISDMWIPGVRILTAAILI